MSDKLAAIRAKMDARPLSIKALKGDSSKAEILLYDSIGFDWWTGGGITAESFSKELDKLDASVKEISVRINSPGGNVFDGITIFNRLKQHKAKIKVRVDGLAASIASIIMLAGDEVTIGEGAMVMIHKPWTGVQGNSDDLDHTSNLLLEMEEQMLGIYQRRSNLTRENLRNMLREETWFGASKAKEYGFADSIDEDVVAIAASALEKRWLKRPPMNCVNVTKVARAEALELSAKIDELLK